jgi:outer membrane protein OmpA-like peptidoglycan-associated protein
LSTRSLVVAALLGSLAYAAPAQAQNHGFQLNRYEPTAAGEWSFAVDHPWYSGTRYFAAGLTLNYAHDPLVLGNQNPDGSFSQTSAIISHQFITHIDLAGSFLDRILLTASLPVLLVSKGDEVQSSVAVGDPRLGIMARLYGQPYQSVFSASIGLSLWLPLRSVITDPSWPAVAGDQTPRLLPKIALGGVWKKLLWSFTGSFLYRAEAVVDASTLPPSATGATVGRAASELQFGVAASYFDQERRFSVGPEILLGTAVLGQDSFSRYGTSLEAMLAGQYSIARVVRVGLALGTGFIRQPGTPDFRMLLRLAYAPERSKDMDTDGDGIADRYDACPTERGVPTGNPRTNGCPPVGDRDHDGVPDVDDLCPDENKGPTPDPQRLGCPLPPNVPVPADRDGDGIPDDRDQCPDLPMGPTPDPQRLGCPAIDSDKDGFLDAVDQCLFEPAGPFPDPLRPGCPLPDRDKDTVPDVHDACPDKPGAPSPDPKKNGCPGLVEVKNGQLVILKPVFFALDKDVILAQSYPVLQAVADALKFATAIKKVRIEGHTDSQGNPAYNIDLSERRTKSVRRWLIEHGIAEDRLEARGYGQTRPIATNKTIAGRAKNRRVEFRIIEGHGAIESPN